MEVLQLAAGQRLRIRHRGCYVADVLSVDNLGRWIPDAVAGSWGGSAAPLIVPAWRLDQPSAAPPCQAGQQAAPR